MLCRMYDKEYFSMSIVLENFVKIKSYALVNLWVLIQRQLLWPVSCASLVHMSLSSINTIQLHLQYQVMGV